MDLYEYESGIIATVSGPVCGVDEAGRGPLAGPVCAAAVILPRDRRIEGLNDSKKLSEKKREALFDEIREKALSYAIAFASVEEIERVPSMTRETAEKVHDFLAETSYDVVKMHEKLD